MNIKLITSTIHNLEFKHLPSSQDETEEEKSFNLSYHPLFPDGEENKTFGNSFKLSLSHPGEFEMEIEYISWFQTSEVIDEEFKQSKFLKINAPAIAYPYLRNAVSMLTLLAGFPSAILPTINFVKFSESNRSLK